MSDMKPKPRTSDEKEEEIFRNQFTKKALKFGGKNIFSFSGNTDELFGACRILGHYSGFEFVEPPYSVLMESHGNAKLEEICRYSHVRYREISLEKDWWKNSELNLLGFYGPERKPIAILNLKSTKYHMVDPLTEESTEITEEIAEKIFPISYSFFAPLPENCTAQNVMKDFYTRYKKLFWSIIYRGLLGSALGLFTPLITKTLFDDVIPSNDYSTFYQIVLGLLVVAFSMFSFQLARSFILLKATSLFQIRINAVIWDHLLQVSLHFFRRLGTGDIIQRTRISDYVSKVIGDHMINIIISTIFSLIYLIPMFYYSWQMSLLGLIAVSISLSITFFRFRYQMNIQRLVLAVNGRINDFLIQIVNGISKVRVANAERRVFQRWGEMFSSSQSLNYRSRNAQVILDVVTTTLSSIFFLAIYWIGFYLLENPVGEGFTIGTFMAFTASYTPFLQAVSSFESTILTLSVIKPLWDRTSIIFEEPSETSSMKINPGKLKGDFAIENVYFRYQPDTPLILHDVSIEVKNGEFVAIIGPSGCGKSTLLRLITGFEKPEKGYVFFNRMDIATLNLELLRRQMGIVFQSTSIIAGTLFENIVCGRSCSAEQIVKAIQLSGLAELIVSLPMGLHTILTSGGTTLSGGQRQRIALARALLTEPKILLLDEATSALDNQAQEELTENLSALSVSRIVIAHRLSTVMKADRIYVMNEGKVVDVGTYQELSKKPGIFESFIGQQKL